MMFLQPHSHAAFLILEKVCHLRPVPRCFTTPGKLFDSLTFLVDALLMMV